MSVDQQIEVLLRIPIVARILERLNQELPSDLKYHSATHARDVLGEAVRFASEDGLSDREIELLAIAAAYHDSGFLERHENNEEIGARFAKEAMTLDGGFSEDEICTVEIMINDTVLTLYGVLSDYCPTHKLSCYLIDADTANLGRTDFFEMAEKVRGELNGISKEEFYPEVLRLIGSHTWHTGAARKLRQEQKEANVLELQRLVESLESSKSD